MHLSDDQVRLLRDLVANLEGKERRVRTAAGARRFKQPIGSVIVDKPDVPSAPRVRAPSSRSSRSEPTRSTSGMPPAVRNVYESFDGPRWAAFRSNCDLGGGCEDVAAAIEKRFGIPQVFGTFTTQSGKREYHSWNQTSDGWIVDGGQDVFPSSESDGETLLFFKPGAKQYEEGKRPRKPKARTTPSKTSLTDAEFREVAYGSADAAEMLTKVASLLGKNAKPDIEDLSDSDIDLYRGMQHADSMTQLLSGTIHSTDFQTWGQGIYVTTLKEEADSYGPVVVGLKLKPGAKILRGETKWDEEAPEMSGLLDFSRLPMTISISDLRNVYWASQGYDGFSPHGRETVLFNTANVIVNGNDVKAIPPSEVFAQDIDSAWAAILTDEARSLEDRKAAHPERYNPSGKPGYGLKDGEIETRVVRQDGPPRIRDYQNHTSAGLTTMSEALEVEGALGMGATGYGRPLVPVGDARPPQHVYRVMSVGEFEAARERGYIKSDERMNLAEGEGTVASLFSTGAFYAPVDGSDYRVVRIRYQDSDGWERDPVDSYIKTQKRVPFDRVDLFSSPIANHIKPKSPEPEDIDVVDTIKIGAPVKSVDKLEANNLIDGLEPTD